MAVAFLEQRLTHAVDASAEQARTSFGALAAKLGALNPLSVLARGYAAVFNANGESVTDAETLQMGDKLDIRLANGRTQAVVTAIGKSEEE